MASADPSSDQLLGLPSSAEDEQLARILRAGLVDDAGIQILDALREELGPITSTITAKQEAFVSKYQTLCQYENALTQLQMLQNQGGVGQLPSEVQEMTRLKQVTEQELVVDAQELLRSRQELKDRLAQCLPHVSDNVRDVAQTLQLWEQTHNAKQDSSASMTTPEFTAARKRCETLASGIVHVYQQVRQHVLLQTQLPLNQAAETELVNTMLAYMDVLGRLLSSALVVISQPPSVLKTQTKFTTTCAFLISDALALFLDPPTVTVSVINESQAIDVNERNQAGLSGLQRQDAVGESGGLQNNQKVLGSASADGVLQAAFKTLSLKKIRRSDKGESDVSVTDEKFSLCYSLTLTLSQGDVVLNLHKLSAPIVVVVHGNQLPSAEATIMWDRAFALPARTGFQVDAVVPWNRVCHALSAYHKHQVGVSLNSDHFVFLSQLAGQSPDNMVYPWPLLAKEPLAGRTFSLWEWFYNICELSRKFLKPVWEAGLIHGFISKDRSEELMMDASPGTFVLRFSASMLGGLSVTWITVDEDGDRQILHLQPWQLKDFAIRNLPERILDLDDLTHLYPGRPKEDSFGPLITPVTKVEKKKASGYVMADIAAVIRQMNTGLRFESRPQSSLDNMDGGGPAKRSVRRDTSRASHTSGRDGMDSRMSSAMSPATPMSAVGGAASSVPVGLSASGMGATSHLSQPRHQEQQLFMPQQGQHQHQQQSLSQQPNMGYGGYAGAAMHSHPQSAGMQAQSTYVTLPSNLGNIASLNPALASGNFDWANMDDFFMGLQQNVPAGAPPTTSSFEAFTSSLIGRGGMNQGQPTSSAPAPGGGSTAV